MSLEPENEVFYLIPSTLEISQESVMAEYGAGGGVSIAEASI